MTQFNIITFTGKQDPQLAGPFYLNDFMSFINYQLKVDQDTKTNERYFRVFVCSGKYPLHGRDLDDSHVDINATVRHDLTSEPSRTVVYTLDDDPIILGEMRTYLAKLDPRDFA